MTGAPPELLRLQRDFARAVQGEDETGLLRPLRGQPPRMAVYRHAWRARLHEALKANHPRLHRALGDEGFAALADSYLAAHPSRQPSIRWFGHRLGRHMALLDEALVPHPALVDIARLDWALGRAFDSADAPALQPAALQALPPPAWGGVRLQAHPSVQRLRLGWDIAPVWHALATDAEAETPEPRPRGHDVLVWRQGLDARWRSLEETEAALLGCAFSGQPLAALGERLAASHGADEAPAALARSLHRWLSEGLLRAPA